MSIKMKIKVTKEILEKSKNCSVDSKGGIGKNCAISYAVIEIFPDAHVSTDFIYPTMDHVLYTSLKINLPFYCKYFISRFDKSSPEERILMDELEFEVELQDEHINMIGSGNLEEVKAIINSSKTLEVC